MPVQSRTAIVLFMLPHIARVLVYATVPSHWLRWGSLQLVAWVDLESQSSQSPRVARTVGLSHHTQPKFLNHVYALLCKQFRADASDNTSSCLHQVSLTWFHGLSGAFCTGHLAQSQPNWHSVNTGCKGHNALGQ
jgi:hypothetical protein